MMNPAEFAQILAVEQSFWWHRGMEEILWRLLDSWGPTLRGARVLEAGAGTGWMSHRLRERYGWNLITSDLSADGIHGGDFVRGRFVQADARLMPHRDGAFAGLISLDMVVHLPRGGEAFAIREFSRVLAPGGWLVLRVAAQDWLRSNHSRFAFERQRFTLRRLRPLLQSAGLVPVRSTYANMLLLPVALAKFRVYEPLFAPVPQSGLELPAPWLNRAMLACLKLEAAMIGAGWRLPVGQSAIVVARKRG